MAHPKLDKLSDEARALLNETGTAFLLPYDQSASAANPTFPLIVAADKLAAMLYDPPTGNVHVIVDGLERAVFCNYFALQEAFLCVQAARTLR